jgi:hypothetical protein
MMKLTEMDYWQAIRDAQEARRYREAAATTTDLEHRQRFRTKAVQCERRVRSMANYIVYLAEKAPAPPAPPDPAKPALVWPFPVSSRPELMAWHAEREETERAARAALMDI